MGGTSAPPEKLSERRFFELAGEGVSVFQRKFLLLLLLPMSCPQCC